MGAAIYSIHENRDSFKLSADILKVGKRAGAGLQAPGGWREVKSMLEGKEYKCEQIFFFLLNMLT